MSYLNTKEIVNNAFKAGLIVPAFNIPHLPMMEAVVEAIKESNSFGLIQVARLEWEKFESKSLKAIRDEYEKYKNVTHTRLHLDHSPVIDEDDLLVDYEAIISEAIALGYESVMVDGSRLSLEENIAATKKAVKLAHDAGLAIEAELGAVLGHESGPLPPYEELFASGEGFTDPEQACTFVKETDVDWLSVSFGNIHGAISGAAKSQKKIAARLSIKTLDQIREVTGIPLVLHGGSGIQVDCLLEAFKHGIAKINIGTTIRQAYEAGVQKSIGQGQDNVYVETKRLIYDELQIAGTVKLVNPF
jgi:fructose-bisphosphate aldolase class II